MSDTERGAPEVDVAVVGAGFGGLACALELARGGARVSLHEALRYPGGCASTFERGGARYEAGATLFSGFGPGQLFDRWIREHALPVRFEAVDPMIELRTGTLSIAIGRSRDAVRDQLAALPGAPEAGLHGFFEEQRVVADALWALFDDPALLPPFGLRALLTHLARTPRYLPVLRRVGRPLEAVLADHGVSGFAPLRAYLDAMSQITVQTAAGEAEAPFALSAMDYPFRGTGHVHGGIGELAWALLRAVGARGGLVRTSDRVQAIERAGDRFVVRARKGLVRARRVVLNLLPEDAAGLIGLPLEGRARRLARAVEDGWGAVMLYLQLAPGELARAGAHHLELVADPARPFVEGNHVFASVSSEDEARAPGGRRTVTVSTHVRMADLRLLDESSRAARIATVQAAMRETIRRRAPELDAAIVHVMPGSPRTFARFVGRREGLVGGIPRRAGLGHYRTLGPFALAPRVYLVGDSVFPGQSTLATALGGARTAEQLLRELGGRRIAALPAEAAQALAG
jgi:phytoene dehydrogenase-like protein